MIKILENALFQIPGGNTKDNAAELNIVALAAITHVNKFCGRFFNLKTAQPMSGTVCSKLFSAFNPNQTNYFGQSKDHRGHPKTTLTRGGS